MEKLCIVFIDRINLLIDYWEIDIYSKSKYKQKGENVCIELLVKSST